MSGEGWSRQLGRALERVDTDQEQCCMSDSDDDELTSDHDQPLANVGDNIEGGGGGMGL